MKKIFGTVLFLILLLILCSSATAAELTLPANLQIIEEEAFYGASSIDKVVLSNNVTEIRAKAFANSTLSEINLPDSLTFIADDAFDGPDKVLVTANVESYAYGWAVRNGYLSIITSINLNKSKLALKPGTSEQLTASITPSNASNLNLSWRCDNPDIATVSNDGTVTAVSEGSANIIATATDGSGATGTCVLTVANELLRIELETNVQNYLLNSTIIAEVETKNSIGTASYCYEVKTEDGSQIEQSEITNSSIFEFSAQTLGKLIITCTATDQAGAYATDSASINIFSSDQIKPITPSNIYLNGTLLSPDENNATVYAQKEFSFTWDESLKNAINSTDSYCIEISMNTGNGYSLIAYNDEVVSSAFELSDSSFNEISQTALVQVQLTSKNLVSGNTTIGYFKVKSLEEQRSISINGESAYDLNSVSYAQCKERITIESDEKWTVEYGEEWIDLHIDETGFDLYIDQNPLQYTRSANVYVSNGYNTAIIHVTQGCVRKAPEIIYPSIASGTNAANTIPSGNLYLELEKNLCDVIVARLLKKSNGSEYELVSSQSATDGSMIISLPDSLIGADCLLEISGYTTEAYSNGNINARDTFARNYYFTVTNDHFVSVDGQSQLSLTITTSKSIIIHASTMWSYTSDADWLSLDVNSAPFYRPDCNVLAITEPNLTSEERVGHLYIYSGTSAAVITIKQPSLVPYATTSKGLSTVERNPTLLHYNKSQFFCYSFNNLQIIDTKTNTILYELSYGNEIKERLFLTWSDIQLSTGKYKMVLSNQYAAAEYYISISIEPYIFSTDVTISLTDDESTGVQNMLWSVPAKASEKTVLLQSERTWNIVSDSDWITLSQTKSEVLQQSETDIVINIEKNSSGVARTANITFKNLGTGVYALLVIEQSALDYISVLNKSTMIPYDDYNTISVDSGSKTVLELQIQAGGAWTVQSNDEWISINSTNTLQYQSKNPYESLNLLLSNNPYGNESRIGTVYFESGDKNFTLLIEQDAQLSPLSKPIIHTDISSISADNPSVYTLHELEITWNNVENAAGYQVSFFNGNDTYNYYIESTNTNEYAFTIPVAWIPINHQIASLSVSALDAQGTPYPSDTYYFVAVMDDKAIINGKLNPEWHDIDDRGDVQSFIIMASDMWNATVDETWIHLSQSSGMDNETLTITVEPNLGDERQGYIYFEVNGNITVMSIRQLKALSIYPHIIAPYYSDNAVLPSVITSFPDSINVIWDYEKQASAYCVYLKTYNEQGVWTSIAESGLITNGIGNYTFSNIPLEQYVIYCISITRIAYGRVNYDTNRYFIIEEETPTIEILKGDRTTYHPTEWIDNRGRVRPADELHMWGEGDCIPLRVTASGAMTVTANDDWVMVASNNLTPEKLAKYHKTVNDYKFMLVPAPVTLAYIGAVSRSVCISALPNYTGHARQGSVTLSCGTYSITIPFTQSAEILPAKLYSPQLSQDSKNVTLLPYEKISLRWYEGQYGTGEYNTVLYEKKPYDTEYQVVKASRISENLYCYINTQYLHKGSDYKLRLYTYGNDGDEVYESYYFHILDDDEAINNSFALISGTVRTASGEAVPDVYVFAVNTADADDSAYALTNASGEWRMSLTAGATYAFEYISMDYTIPGSTKKVSAHLSLSAVAELPGEIDESLSFTMKQDGEVVDTIEVGTAVDFTVTAPGAKFVRLVVDGKAYEEYAVTDGIAQFTRTFSLAGNRSVQFQIMKSNEYAYSDLSQVSALNILSPHGTLQETTIHEIGMITLDNAETLTISWDSVPNAVSYTVYLYYNGNQYFPLGSSIEDATTEDTSFTLSFNEFSLFAGENWSASIVAVGAPGYSSSTSAIGFTVVETLGQAAIVDLPASQSVRLGDLISGGIYRRQDVSSVSMRVQKPGDADETEVQLTDDAFEFTADRAGTFVLRLYVNGSATPCASAAIEVPEPRIITDDNGRAMFDINGYRQFEYEFDETPLNIHVTYNFVPTIVKVYRNQTLIEEIENNEKFADFSIETILENEGTVSEYQVIACYGEDISVPSAVFPVYCVSEQTAEQKTWHAVRNTQLYQRPNGTVSLNTVLENDLVQLGGSAFGDYFEVTYRGKTGFVYAGDIQPHGALSDDQIIISSSLDDMTNKIVWLQNEGDARDITFTIQTSDNVVRLRAFKCIVPAGEYQSPSPAGTGEWVERDAGSTVFTYTVTFDQLACYDVEFAGFDKDGNMLTAYTQACGQYIPTVLRQESSHVRKYAKCEAFMNHKLTLSPLDDAATCEVDPDERITVMGNAGGGYSYVISAKGDGFIPTEDLLSSPNHTVLRAYILASENIYDNDIGKQGTGDNNVYLPTANGVRLMTSLFGDKKISNLYPDYSVSNADLDAYLAKIKKETDFNDVTYLYILAHGTTKGILMNKDGSYYYLWDLAHNLNGIEGKLVFFLGACHSGALKDYLQGLDKTKYSIIMAASSTETAHAIRENCMYNTSSEEQYPYLDMSIKKSLPNKSNITLGEVFEAATNQYNTFLDYFKNNVYPTCVIEDDPPDYMEGVWWPYERYEKEKFRQHFQVYGNPNNIIFP